MAPVLLSRSRSAEFLHAGRQCFQVDAGGSNQGRANFCPYRNRTVQQHVNNRSEKIEINNNPICGIDTCSKL